MRTAAWAMRASALLVVLTGLPPAAEALSVGSLRQVGDLRGVELPPSSLDCPTADALIDHWEFELDFDPYETWLRLWRSSRDRQGRELEPRRLLLERDIGRANSVARQCRSDGGVLISTYTREAGCTRLIEELDRDGMIDAFACVEASGRFGFPGSSYHVDLSLGDGSFLVAGSGRDVNLRADRDSVVGAARYSSAEGWVEAEAAFVGSTTDNISGVAVASDALGGILIIWTVTDASGVGSLWARRLDRSGRPRGDAIRVHQAPLGLRHGSAVVATGPGEFVVAWRSFEGPGWLGRSVAFASSVTTTLPTATTTTTTLSAYEVPRLDQATELAVADWLGESDLATDGDGTWMAVWRAPGDLGGTRGFVSASWNDGRSWSEPLALPEATVAWQERSYGTHESTGISIASDGEGTWIVALMRQPQRWECWVELVVSTDNGRSWQPSGVESEDYGRLVTFPETYDDQSCRGTDIAWAGGEEWVFALSCLADGDGYFDSAQVFLASSGDGGWSWQGSSWPLEDAIDQGSNSAPTIVTTRGGASVVAWRSNDLRATQWSGPPVASLSPAGEPRTWISGLDPYPETWLHPYGLSLASGSEGALVAAWPARDFSAASHGWDPDIVVARSDDLGSSWSLPSAVAPYALWDGAVDATPVLAAGAAGHYLLAWQSYLGERRLSGGEVVLAFSDDAGRSWSAPLLANSSADGRRALVQRLVGDKRDRWALLTLTSSSTEAALTRVVVSMTSADCGDGVVDDDEYCDDGNAVDGDGCDSNCTATACGNGVVSAGETCDDGNPWPGDACSPTCEPTYCGDGVVRTGVEACDDGNRIDDDGCLSGCEEAVCGDGFLWRNHEQCDDGNQVDGDGCDSNCTLPRCGNGVVNAGEQCDDGDSDDSDGCLHNCRLNVCGDGYRLRIGRGREACDDGNLVDGDGCDSNCHPTGCGNGIVTAGEDCDDGNRRDDDYCGADCRFDECGNGRVGRHGREREACDDGNLVDGDGCDSNCTLSACGNGIATDGEQCDDGNASSLDGCLPGCVNNICGDGYAWIGVEQCDDGNVRDGDGCSAACEVEGLCGDADGDGVVTATDARHVLAYSVALLSSCSEYVCDVDANGYINVRDARAILLQAVGLREGVFCVASRMTVVFRLASPVVFSALQFGVDYAQASGEFAGDRGAAQCESMLESGFRSFNNQLDERILNIALVDILGVEGPADLVACTFLSPGHFDRTQLQIDVVDAAAPGLTPIVPRPLITVSLSPARAH